MEPSGRTDPRQVRTRVRVLAAARSVMRREGVGGTTVDAIADEAGVARSTVYRNWPGLHDLLADAVADVADPAVGPAAGTPIEQVESVVRQLARALDDSEWGATLPAVIAAAEAAPDLAERYRAFTESRRRSLRVILRAAVASGDLPAGTVLDDVVDALVGPLFYRRLVRRVPTSAPWVERHVARTIASFGAAR